MSGPLHRLGLRGALILLTSCALATAFGGWALVNRALLLPQAVQALQDAAGQRLIEALAVGVTAEDVAAMIDAPPSVPAARLTAWVEGAHLPADALRLIQVSPGAEPPGAGRIALGPAPGQAWQPSPLLAPAVRVALGGEVGIGHIPQRPLKPDTAFVAPISPTVGAPAALAVLILPHDYYRRFADQAALARLNWQGMILALMTVAAGALAVATLVHRALAPLRLLAAGVAEVGAGRYDHRIALGALAAELAPIGRAVNALAEAVGERTRTLEASERRYRALFEASQEALLLVNPRDGRIVDANPFAVKLMGRPEGQLLGASFEALWGEPAGDPALAGRGGDGQGVSRSLTRADGARRIVELRRAPVEIPGGAHELVSCRDVTDDHLRWERALHAHKLSTLGLVAAGLAHQLNNPLVGALNFAQLLRGRLPEGSTEAELAAQIEEATARCRDTVRAMLRFGRQRPPSLEPTPVAVVFEDVALLSTDELRGRRVHLEVCPPPADLSLCCDRIQLAQALINLVENGARAAGAGGHIRLAAVRRAPFVDLEVEDDGPGIPPDILHQVLEPFFTTRPPGEGTGLGMPVADGIARAHGGSLSVSRSGPEGTLMRLRVRERPQALDTHRPQEV